MLETNAITIITNPFEIRTVNFVTGTFVQIVFNKVFTTKFHFLIHFHQALQFQLGFIDYLSSTVGGLGQGESDTVIAINIPDLHRNTLRSMWVFFQIL